MLFRHVGHESLVLELCKPQVMRQAVVQLAATLCNFDESALAGDKNTKSRWFNIWPAKTK